MSDDLKELLAKLRALLWGEGVPEAVLEQADELLEEAYFMGCNDGHGAGYSRGMADA